MKAPTLARSRATLCLTLGVILVHAGCGNDSPSAQSWNLSILVNGGTSSVAVVSQPAGLACRSSCAAAFAAGTMVTLSAQAIAPQEFVGWEGACTGTSPTCSVTMDAAKDVRASFQIRHVRVTLAISGNGMVTSMPAAFLCPGTCAASFPVNTVLNLIAAPGSTAAFTGWGGACTTLASACTVVLSADTQITASFGNPVGCAELRAIDPTAKNGNYKLFVNGDPAKPWDAFCQMTTFPGLTYLSLNNLGANQNFSQYTAGGSSSGTSVRTSYTKVRIDPAALKISTSDQSFATSSGGPLLHGGTPVTAMTYAAAMGCAGGANGVANIDLAGTPFAVAAAALGVGGFAAVGTTTPTPDGQLRALNLTGGGSCGWNSPVGAANPFNQNGGLLSLVYAP